MNRTLTVLLLLFLVADTGFSFYQHYHYPLDGDMAAIILPSAWYSHVLQDPFGLSVLRDAHPYAAPNRFFAHWPFAVYFKTVPLWLQHFTTPVKSLYLACALAKTLVQVGLLWVLSAYCTGSANAKRPGLLLTAALLAPLFQSAGYCYYFGIIDPAVTYTFFYALAMLLLLLFFLPFYLAFAQRRPVRLNAVQHLLLLGLAVVLPLQGPLNAAVVLLVAPAVLLGYGWRGFCLAAGKPFLSRSVTALCYIPPPVLGYFSLISLISLYSLYLGQFNAENTAATLALSERYLRLGPGLLIQLSRKLAYPLLLLVLLVNVLLLKRHGTEGSRYLTILKWLCLLSALYLLLLPLGGYRSYRPFIVRRDTFLPVTLAMLYFFGLTTFALLRQLPGRQKKLYLAGLVVFSAIFINADRATTNPFYECERASLEIIARSAADVVEIPFDCRIMSWDTIRYPEASETNARLLQLWRVTEKKQLYFRPE